MGGEGGRLKMIVKVCGMRNADNIREVERLFTLYSSLFTPLMGFIFWPKSSRYVNKRPSYLPTKCKRVGVFVDADIDEVKRTADSFTLDFIQLHGHETPEYCRQLKGKSLIKAFNIASAEDFANTIPYEGCVDYFLFDTKGKSVGGNGVKFDWSVLDNYTGKTPFLLSGGVGNDDAQQIRALHHPLLAGIDLNSKFEIEPGLKDINKLSSFLKQLKS